MEALRRDGGLIERQPKTERLISTIERVIAGEIDLSGIQFHQHLDEMKDFAAHISLALFTNL